MTGRYAVLEHVADGGMGTVFRAYDSRLHREVALKRVRLDEWGEESEARLMREAQAMARLTHPNVVAVYDILEETDGIVMAMEFVDGMTLSEWVAAAPRTYQEIVGKFIAAGVGLAAAHRAGLVHRDFKPSNVLVGADGSVKVTDFGLVKAVGEPRDTDVSTPERRDPSLSLEIYLGEDDSAEPLTECDTTVGTPRYMSPEQHAAEPSDARTDQYAFCVALWHALQDEPPFHGDINALAMAKNAGPPEWPRRPGVPTWLGAALRRGLAPEPDDRYPNMQALLTALSRNPRRARIRNSVLASGLAAVSLYYGGQEQARRNGLAECETVADPLRDSYDEATRTRLRQAFVQSRPGIGETVWQRVDNRLQQWVARWAEDRQAVCAAEVEADEPSAVLQTTRECLDEQSMQFASLLEIFADPSPSLVHIALSAAFTLPASSACADDPGVTLRARPPADDPELQRRVAEVRRQRPRVSVLLGAQRIADAERVADRLLQEAQALGWAPLVAEMKLATAFANHKLGRYDAAEAALEDAYFEASRSGHDEVATRAANALVYVVGVTQGRFEEGLRWGRLSQTMVQRLGLAGTGHETMLLANLGALHVEHGDPAEGVGYLERTLAGYVAVVGENHPDVAQLRINLGLAYFRIGRTGRALQLYEEALDVGRRLLGEDHAIVASAHIARGEVLALLGDPDGALQSTLRGLELQQAILPPSHPAIAYAWTDLGELYAARGDFDLAATFHRRAVQHLEHGLGPTHPALVDQLQRSGRTSLAAGRLAEAANQLERAIAIAEAGPDPSRAAVAMAGLAEVYLAWDELPRAWELAQRARGIAPERGADRVTVMLTAGRVQRRRARFEDAIEVLIAARAAAVHAAVPATQLATLERELADARGGTAA